MTAANLIVQPETYVCIDQGQKYNASLKLRTIWVKYWYFNMLQ